MVSILSKVDETALDEVCQRFRVRKLSVFGSVVRGEARPDSDIDLLLEYESGSTPPYFGMEDLAESLCPIFGGRSVDLVFPDSLHWLICDQVLKSAKIIYER